MKKLISLVLSVVLMTAIGCASIVSRSNYPVKIGSEPKHVSLTITDKSGKTIFSGETPTVLTLDASSGFFQGQTYHMVFSKDGYTTHETYLSSGIDGWYMGNILFGGPLGLLIIDPATGAMWRLDDEVFANLTMENSEENITEISKSVPKLIIKEEYDNSQNM